MGSEMTITPLRDYFKSGSIPDLEVKDDPRIRDLAIMLDPYTRDGQYATLLRRQGQYRFQRTTSWSSRTRN